MNLIKKMVHYIHPSLLVEACSPDSSTYNLGTMLVEVIATVLDNEVCHIFDNWKLGSIYVVIFAKQNSCVPLNRMN